MSADRILIISHGHPDLSLGGGEISAHLQWQELRRQGVEAMFLARSDTPSGHVGTPFTARSADGREVLFHAPPVDHFRHSQPQRRLVYEDFRALLERFAPTAVHFHHYVHLGLELVREARRYSSEIPILMTLHDYLGMCNAQGQMRKTNGMLCRRAVPLDCHGCFPERSPQDFFLRELFVKSFFALVDRFICPSQFLRDRYVAWGLPAEKMVVLENGISPAPAVAKSTVATTATSATEAAGAAEPAAAKAAPVRRPRVITPPPGTEPPEAPPVRFAVLGQLSELKGTLVLLEAAMALPKPIRRRVRIAIHGSLRHAPENVREALKSAQTALAPMLTYGGPYLPANVDAIVRGADWVIVPSIWWENSPLVIQEAFRAGRPVICSNIGGMAEKVSHGVNGLHFLVGSATDLARCIEQAVNDPGLQQRLAQAAPQPPAVQETVARQLVLYRSGRTLADRLRVVASGA